MIKLKFGDFIKQAASLSVLQFAGYVFPLILLFIISRNYEGEKVSLFLMMQTIAILLAMPVEYGFHLSGVRLIALAENTLEKRRIFTTVTLVKFLIFFPVCLFVLPLVMFNSAIASSDLSLNIICVNIILIIFTVGFRPLWFFQGDSNYRILIYLELIANVLTVIAVLILVALRVNFEIVLLFNVVPKVLGLLVVHCKYMEVKLYNFRFAEVVFLLQRGFPLFLHKVSAGFLHSAIPYILSFGVSAVALFKYQQAEKIFYVSQGFLLILSQIGYANVLKINSKLNATNWNERWIQLAIQLILSTLSAIVIFAFAPFVLEIFWTKADEDVVQLLRFFCPLYILLGLNASLGLVFLLSFGKDVAVVKSAMIGAFFSILYLLSTYEARSIYDGLISIYIGEIILLIVMVYEIKLMRCYERSY